MTLDGVIAECERAWSLGWGGWWRLPVEERERILGWWWESTRQDAIREEASKAKARASQPTVRSVTGRRAR